MVTRTRTMRMITPAKMIMITRILITRTTRTIMINYNNVDNPDNNNDK